MLSIISLQGHTDQRRNEEVLHTQQLGHDNKKTQRISDVAEGMKKMEPSYSAGVRGGDTDIQSTTGILPEV